LKLKENTPEEDQVQCGYNRKERYNAEGRKNMGRN
jgi:hypothetical protein